MKKILVLEDDYELNDGICYALQKEGYSMFSAHSIEDAKGLYLRNHIDLILLDVNLPDGEGFSFCTWVKKQNEIPVLFISARDLEADMLKGYELGADDYITKPFSIKVLLEKIKIVLKRNETIKSNVYEDDYIKINFDSGKVEIAGQECNVTPTEFRILKIFLTNKGKLLTYSVLIDYLWDSGSQFVDKHALAVNINRLRGKIETEEKKYISNVYGMGYLWMS